MDKGTFARYKFKPSDVIEGLNRYFAESKAFRYRRVPLEIHNGTVKPGNYYVFRNIIFDVSTPKIKELGYYYVICDPEEVVGVAINWLREEHDIFYTPGMNEPPIKDPDDIFCMENLKETKNFSVTTDDFVKWYSEEDLREALGIAEDSDILQCIKRRNSQLEILRTEVAIARRNYHKAVEERNQFGKRLADIRKAAGMSDFNPMDLVEYIRDLAKSRRESLDSWYDEHATVLDMKDEIIKVYREIFDCSNGDPEGTDAEALQDILTEYKRCLELKNVAEEKTIKYKELARENEERLAKEKEWTKRLEQKLIEIQDICER